MAREDRPGTRSWSTSSAHSIVQLDSLLYSCQVALAELQRCTVRDMDQFNLNLSTSKPLNLSRVDKTVSVQRVELNASRVRTEGRNVAKKIL